MTGTPTEEDGRSLAREWLAVLLSRAERGAAKGSPRAIASTQAMFRRYKESRDVDFRRGVHEVLNNGRVRDAIELVWEPHYEGHELRKIRLRSVDSLRDLLGSISLAQTANAAMQKARAACLRSGAAPNPQLGQLLDDLGNAWRLGEAHCGLRTEAMAEVVTALKTVAAILAGEHQDLDMRTFSIKVHGQSKTVENARRPIERILQALFPSVDRERGFDLLAYLGLEKTPQPFFVGGYHRVQFKGGGGFQLNEYLGIPRSRMADMEVVSQVTGILIVENWTTYAKAACAAPAQWLVFFCSGFPSPAWIEVAKGLVAQWPSALLLHWGDLDLGGFRIFEHLSSTLSGRIRPHLMTPAAYPADGTGMELTPGDLRELRRIATRIPALRRSVDEIEAAKRFGLEQEAIQIPRSWGLP
jgi:hypothetical protein